MTRQSAGLAPASPGREFGTQLEQIMARTTAAPAGRRRRLRLPPGIAALAAAGAAVSVLALALGHTKPSTALYCVLGIALIIAAVSALSTITLIILNPRLASRWIR